MHDDLQDLDREKLVREVKRLGYASIATAQDTNSVGTIQNCGDCCPRRATLFQPFMPGHSFCEPA